MVELSACKQCSSDLIVVLVQVDVNSNNDRWRQHPNICINAMNNSNPGSLQLQNTVAFSTLSTFQYSLYTNIIYIYISKYTYIYIYRVNVDGLVRHHEITGSMNPGRCELLSSLGFVVSVARCTKPQYFSSPFIGLIRNLESWRMPTNAAHFAQSNVAHPGHPY